jgi:predicted TIM-barrel enzyme
LLIIPDIIPVPENFLDHKKAPAQIIGMVHVPSNNILMSQQDWLSKLELPKMKSKDFEIILKLQRGFEEIIRSVEIPSFKKEFPGGIALSNEIESLNKDLSRLSFMNYLKERVLNEIEIYIRNGISILQFENVGAPYFLRQSVPAEEQLIMNYIVKIARQEYPDLPMGIQVLAFADNIALEIAIRHKLFYIRGESFLFQGCRPEGLTENQGNLAKAYYMRNFFNLSLGRENIYPNIYPDLLKKHTIFNEELNDLNIWLENITFQKLEGVVLTGKKTGSTVKESELIMTRQILNEVNKNYQKASGTKKIPLISGSGANPGNIHIYKKYMDYIIIGSYHKRDGYWENGIDEDRLSFFRGL